MANHCWQRQDSNSVEGKTGRQITAGRDRRISIQYTVREDGIANPCSKRHISVEKERTARQITAVKDRMGFLCW
jgi:hypothetical protein